MNTEKYQTLYQFLSGYFHQDWPEEFGTVEEVIKAFIINEPEVIRRKAHSELEHLIYDIGNRKVDQTILDELGCYYNPEVDGVTILDWLQFLCSKLA